MRRLLPLAALAILLAFAPNADAGSRYVLSGRGWGHGIGMSQYGAYGFARHGFTFDDILAHYYPGTSLGTRSDEVRVRLAAGSSALTIGSAAAFHAGAVDLAAGTWRVTVAADGRLKLVNGASTRRVPANTRFEPGTRVLALNGDRYRGAIRIRATSAKLLWALNILGLDSYVKGVVPQEMPPSWHLEALKVQAVAARSYALAAGGHCAWFGQSVMCPDTSDQVYGGLDAEEPSSNTAVNRTAGDVLLFRGDVATTFFFSTSGGKTAAKHDEWGGTPVPYLVSVDDPFENFSPHHRWGPDAFEDCGGSARDCVYSTSELSKLLGTRGLRDVTVVRNPSSRVDHVNITRTSGPSTLTGAQMRSTLGLRSTWFSIGLLRLNAADVRIEWGRRTTLSAFVRGLRGAVLERRRFGGSWRDVQAVKDPAELTVSPGITTWFRLGTPSVTGVTVRISVEPRLRIQTVRPSSLAGTMRPRLAGTTVSIQRLTATGWKNVAQATVNASGDWKAVLPVRHGATYRAHAAPGQGYVPGTSPAVQFD